MNWVTFKYFILLFYHSSKCLTTQYNIWHVRYFDNYSVNHPSKQQNLTDVLNYMYTLSKSNCDVISCFPLVTWYVKIITFLISASDAHIQQCHLHLQMLSRQSDACNWPQIVITSASVWTLWHCFCTFLATFWWWGWGWALPVHHGAQRFLPKVHV